MSELKPMFNNCVLMNDNAIDNQAVMNVLQSLADDNFEFRSIDSTHYNISDRDKASIVNNNVGAIPTNLIDSLSITIDRPLLSMERPLLNRFSINLKDGKEIFVVDDNDLFDEALCQQYNINYI